MTTESGGAQHTEPPEAERREPPGTPPREIPRARRAGDATAGRRVRLALGALCLAVVAAVAGYALNLGLSAGDAEPAEAAAEEGEDSGEGDEDGQAEAAAPGPFGNAAGLSYTRLGGTDFLVVRDGAAVATLSPQSAQVTEGGVAIDFGAEYHPRDGEWVVRAEHFFHYAHPGGTVPDAGDDTLRLTPEGAELAVLTPEQPEQEFTLELPGAPHAGALSYDPAEELDRGLAYRTPLCYQVDGDFSPHREDCEIVPEPGGF